MAVVLEHVCVLHFSMCAANVTFTKSSDHRAGFSLSLSLSVGRQQAARGPPHPPNCPHPHSSSPSLAQISGSHEVSQLVMMSSFTFLTTSTLRLHLSCCCQAPARPPPLRFVRQCVAGRQVGGRQAGSAHAKPAVGVSRTSSERCSSNTKWQSHCAGWRLRSCPLRAHTIAAAPC